MVSELTIHHPIGFRSNGVQSELSTIVSHATPSSDPSFRVESVRVRLLQPLADPDLFSASDDAGDDYLSITALGLAWRQAFLRVDPISSITFDLTSPPIHLSQYISVQQVSTLLRTIAIATRLRGGEKLHFDVVWDGLENRSRPFLFRSEDDLVHLKEDLLSLGERLEDMTKKQITDEAL
jgi:hypothetical protein